MNRKQLTVFGHLRTKMKHFNALNKNLGLYSVSGTVQMLNSTLVRSLKQPNDLCFSQFDYAMLLK